MMSVLGADVCFYIMMGTAALGALIATASPFLVGESATRQGLGLGRAAAQQPADDSRPFWRRRRDAVRQIRAYLGKRVTSDGLPVEATPGEGEGHSSASSGGRTTSPLRTTSEPALAAREMSQPEVDPSEPTAEAEPVAQTQAVPDGGEAGAEPPGKDNLLDLLSDEVTEPDGTGDSQDEDEADEDTDESDDASGDDSSGKSGDPDSLFSLFETEIEEENEMSELAASLEDVDIRDLLTEAQQVLNEVRSGRHAGDR